MSDSLISEVNNSVGTRVCVWDGTNVRFGSGGLWCIRGRLSVDSAGGVCSLSAMKCSTSCSDCSVVSWAILTKRSCAHSGSAPALSSFTTSTFISWTLCLRQGDSSVVG